MKKNPISLAVLATAAALVLTGCAPEPEPEPELTFEVVAYVDGEEFQPNQQIMFDALVPNQTQSKVILVENLSNQDIVITNLSLITAGDLFDGDDVTVQVVKDDGETFDGTVLEPNASVSGVISLATSDGLRPGLTGIASLGFDTAPAAQIEEQPTD